MKLKLIIPTLICAGFLIWLLQPNSTQETRLQIPDSNSQKVEGTDYPPDQEFSSPASSQNQVSAEPTNNASKANGGLTNAPLALTSANFESFVLQCFQGEQCELSEDPMGLYRDFKTAGNRRANDHLISFLRSKLKDPKFRDQYKVALRQMIDDFYPLEEKQFQLAAYYNYLGDLDRSLELYLDLEKKAATDPTLRPAPKINIANTFYDQGRFREALPYYQAALKEYLSRQREVIFPSQNEMFRFIEGRIDEIEWKISQDL